MGNEGAKSGERAENVRAFRAFCEIRTEMVQQTRWESGALASERFAREYDIL